MAPIPTTTLQELIETASKATPGPWNYVAAFGFVCPPDTIIALASELIAAREEIKETHDKIGGEK